MTPESSNDSSGDAPARPSAPAAAQPVVQTAVPADATEATAAGSNDPAAPPREYGGRKDGTEPTRYGDWEKHGRCIDF